MRAHQIMTRNVLTVTPDTPVVDAATLMLKNHVSGLPVVNGAGKLVGIVTEGDFLRRAETGTQRKRPKWLQFFVGSGRAGEEFVRERGRKVDEVMTPEPVTVDEETPLDQIVDVMEKRHIKRVPVMRHDRLVGIVARASLMQAVVNLAREIPDPTADDDHIRDRILRTAEKTTWCPIGFQVTVRNGVVHLHGVVLDERARRAAIVAAETTDGVKQVHDHLCWVDGYSGCYVESEEDRKAAG